MDSVSQTVVVKKLEGHPITIITINRPDARNAVDRKTAQCLYDAFIAFENDANQKICVFAGAGGTFCAGADLKAFAREAENEPWNELPAVQGRNLAPMGPLRLQVKKPVIAAVSGYAVAGGLELSLLADLRVVERDAVFGVFCRRWGVPLIDGGTVRLQAVVGYGRAMDMILTGRPVNADEALAMGLANRVVEKGTATEAAIALARDLLKFPYACMLADRASVAYSAFSASSFEDAMANEFNGGAPVLREASKGAARFSAGAGRHGDYGKL
ncbi:3-hydroxypropionyl-coenzyme A dehydratase [Cyphellophora attinorum]|uniref:3-hydroxypropionyl-coenzyme A dehydratase n=1 Tax=Cyphellophora attinorum TaxID=1664694 RepID=A0A0N1H1Q5_9EURO|nr:3-hydroxypropionyl-coenzyme A dehydratase [Phialophora attinorum]KPI38126.1 3-hydroxypropionyl-coenzyme A dehydratase [Phialophora attinorum]